MGLNRPTFFLILRNIIEFILKKIKMFQGNKENFHMYYLDGYFDLLLFKNRDIKILLLIALK